MSAPSWKWNIADMSKIDGSFYGSRDEWYDRLNLVNKVKRFCQLCTSRYEFWLAVAIFALTEPILCSRWPVGWILFWQVIVLGVSTILYVIQLIGVASREWDKIVMIEAMSSLQSLAIPKHVTDITLLKIFIFFTAEGEYILEFGCLLIGWALIFWHPGLAALRCFRPFRLLWFYEVEIFRSRTEYYFNPLLGDVFVSRGFRVLKFAIKALSALGNEMFRLTNETKGGLLLMMIFFYSAFVLGASLWVETAGDNDFCDTLGECMYNLMRLTFFDGTGFDFAYTLTNRHRILFFIVMTYMCLTSFGILNGLVGIFGTAFAHASDLAFEDEEEHQQNVAVNAAEQMKHQERGGYGVSNDDDVRFNDDGGGEGSMKSEGGESVNVYTDMEMQAVSGGGGGGSDSDGNNSNSKMVKSIEISDEYDRRRQIASMMSGGSKFAMNELMKAPLNKPRSGMTLKDVVKKTTSPKGSSVYSEQQIKGLQSGMMGTSSRFNVNVTNAANNNSDVNNQVPSQERTRKALGGMFNRQRSGKMSTTGNGGGLNSVAGSMAQMYGTGGHGINTNAHQLMNMTVQMTAMQTKIDKQNEVIGAMFEHITHLTKQLQVLHPELAKIEQPKERKKSTPAAVNDSPMSSPGGSLDSFGVSPVKPVVGGKHKNLMLNSNNSSAASSELNVKAKLGLPSMLELPNEDEAVSDFTAQDALGSMYQLLPK